MKRFRFIAPAISAALFLLLVALLAFHGGLPVLDPSGTIGMEERKLLVYAVLLMLIVVVPVVALAIFVAWRYREGNTKAAYRPDWEHSRMEEFIWWTIPLEIVLVLGALTWSGTHALDPEKTIASGDPPVVIDVVALPWKWLFIYPEEGVASVNEVAIPAGRTIEFHVTADAPMNSFWVPALGGQIYAMSGMDTVLHLSAAAEGVYQGRSANYSGDGFSKMTFTVHALSPADYDAWVAKAKSSSTTLTRDSYHALAAPGETIAARYYGAIGMSYSDILMESMGGMHH